MRARTYLFEVNTENVTFQLYMLTYARQKVPYFLTLAIVFFVCNPKQTFSDSLTYKTQDAFSVFAIHVQAIVCCYLRDCNLMISISLEQYQLHFKNVFI